MAEDGIGSVSVEVVPSAERFWRRFEEQTRAGAAAAGERTRAQFDRTFERGPSTIRIKADTTEARAQMAALNRDANRSSGVMEKLISAAITLAPAIVPIAAAAGAAAAEFGVLAISAGLALKGLKDDAKGAGQDITVTVGLIGSMKSSLNELSQTAAHGALPGLADAAAKLHAELPAVNAEISKQSALLGEVASHVAGGLAGGFTTFAPVLNEVAGSVDRIATRFEAWATGPGGSALAETLTEDYARVAPIIDDIGSAVLHLIDAGHASGLGILSELQVLAQVVSSFPTPALELIIATFVSARTLRALSGVFTGLAGAVDTAMTRVMARTRAAAAATEASAAQAASAAAAEASALATAQAEAAAAYAAAQLEIAQATVGTEAALTGLAAVAVESSAQLAAAAQVGADAAVAAAAEMAAAAETAAAESTAAAEVSSLSWSSMLGPIGIVAGALGLLGLSFLNSSDDTNKATSSLQDYTQALVQSGGAIDGAVRQRVAGNQTLLSDVDEFQKAGVSLNQVVNDITDLKSPVLNTIDTITAAFHAGKISRSEWQDLLTDVHAAGHEFSSAARQADAERKALNSVSASVSQQVGLLHTNAAAYQAAKKAAADSTNQAKQQTLQWQLENNAGKLLQETLDKLAGKQLSYAQAENQFQSSLVTMAQALQQGSNGLRGLSSDAITNRSNLLQLVQSAEQTAAAYGDMKHSTLAGRQELIKLRQQIIDNAVAHGEDRTQVEKYIDSILKIPTKAGTELTIKDAKAKQQARELQRYIKQLDWAVTVQAKGGATTRKSGIGIEGLATGGGLPEGWAAVGERGAELVHKSGPVVQVFSHQQSKRIVASTGMRAPGFAGGTGGPGGDVVTISKNDSKAPKPKKAADHTVYTVAGQQYSSLGAAENAAERLFKAQVTLGVKIDDKDLTSFRHALSGTVDQARTAFQTIYTDARKLGIGDKLASVLRAENKRLDTVISDRNRAKDRLKAVTDQFVQVRDSVKSAGEGSFDVTTAGRGFDGQQVGSFDSLQADEKQSLNIVKAWAAGIKKLGKTFGKTAAGRQFLEQLSTSDPRQVLPEIKELLSASPKDLASFVSTEAQIRSTSAGLGNFVGNSLYGKQISNLQKEIHIDNASIKALGKEIVHQVREAVKGDEHRPIIIKVGDQEIARVTAAGAKKNARRT